MNDFRELTIDDIRRAAERMSTQGIMAVAAAFKSPADRRAKYGDVSLGQVEALLNKMLRDVPADEVDEVIRGILSDHITMTRQDVIRILFDPDGRCIPTADRTVTADVCDLDLRYHISRLDHAGSSHFNKVLQLTSWSRLFGQECTISADELIDRVNAIKQRVKDDPRIENLLRGCWFPVLLPKISKGDYGHVLETELLPAVKRGYEADFPNRQFINSREGKLTKQVTIVNDRHKQLIKDMQSEQIVGIVCYPLQGFSVHAQRQMAMLMPEYISLLGAMDAAAAEALYPLQLSRDNNTPVRDCSAVQWRAPVFSLDFSARNGMLEFSDRYTLEIAIGDCSGGFLLRG